MYGIELIGTWTQDEQRAILQAAIDTGIALKNLGGLGSTSAEAFRKVMEGPSSLPTRKIKFNRSNTPTFCATTPLTGTYSASIDCNPSVVMTKYTAVHEFGHVFNERTSAAFRTAITYPLRTAQDPTNQLPLLDGPNITDDTIIGLRGYVLSDFGQKQDFQRSHLTTDNGWGSAASRPTVESDTYSLSQGGSLIVPRLGPCDNGAPSGLPVGAPFIYQQNPCTFANWGWPELDLLDQGRTPESNEAAADMFLNWVYSAYAFQNMLWRGGTPSCYPNGCPDVDLSGTKRSDWMAAKMSELKTQLAD